MFQTDQYELLDFGEGRKLERFGPFILDRPSPAAADSAKVQPGLWGQAHVRYERFDDSQGSWKPEGALPSTWTIRHGGMTLELKSTPFGHLGVFPEQAENWDWLAEHVSAPGAEPAPSAPLQSGGRHRCKVLNLFAYTGGSTLAAAGVGAEVVHVDAASNVVAWARRNAAISGLEQAPIRWIPEDASKFVAREVARGNAYDAVILDPPSYGHGPHGEVWKLDRDLPGLLRDCAQLTGGRPRLMLLTCHSPNYDAARLRSILTDAGFHADGSTFTVSPLTLATQDGRKLSSGLAARWRRDA